MAEICHHRKLRIVNMFSIVRSFVQAQFFFNCSIIFLVKQFRCWASMPYFDHSCLKIFFLENRSIARAYSQQILITFFDLNFNLNFTVTRKDENNQTIKKNPMCTLTKFLVLKFNWFESLAWTPSEPLYGNQSPQKIIKEQ